MTKSVYDSYVNDGWKVFALYLARTDKEKVKGNHGTPPAWNDMDKPNSPYKETSVYGGIPPKDIVAIDWDVKNGRKGDQSFLKLCVDLGAELATVVNTPSGGGHCYLRINPDILLNKAQAEYPDIDFIGHGREWVALGGQTLDGQGEYTFTDEDFEYFVNPLQDVSFMQQRKEYSKEGAYAGVDADLHFMERMPIEQIQEYLDQLDPNMSYEGGWQNVIMALNSWDLGGEIGLQLAIDWSQKSTQYSATEEEITAKYEESIPDVPQFYLKLMGMVNRTSISAIREKLSTVETLEEFEELAASVAPLSISKDDRATLLEEMTEVGRAPNLYGRRRGSAIQKLMSYKPIQEIVERESVLQVYAQRNHYALRAGNTIEEGLTKAGVTANLMACGVTNKDEREMLITKAIRLYKDVVIEPDYTMSERVSYVTTNIEGDDRVILTQRNNPLFNLSCDNIEDRAIIDEYTQGVWNGKIIDVVRLIALTIKYDETKLNRLMLVAPSNVGKTVFATVLNFQKSTMAPFLAAMRGIKGMGTPIVDGIRETGLLLLDEVNTALPLEMKDMDKELQIVQFGAGGGTQVLPLKFTVLTSTHKTATRNNSDELYNRFLQVELLESEMTHTITEGKYYKLNNVRYTEVIESYTRRMFKEAFEEETDISELKELQAKYRLPSNNDLDEILFEISEKIIKDVKAKAREGVHSDYLLRNGVYYAKRKRDIYDSAEDFLSELADLDHGKYAEKLSSHFVGDRISVKIDNTVASYYQLNVVVFGENEEQAIVNHFDDLDIDEL